MNKPAPIASLKAKQIRWLAANRCIHRHSFLEHYTCFLRQKKGVQERIGFLDIEASNLDADFGIMLSYCIKDCGKKTIYESVLTKHDINSYPPGQEDRRLVQNIVKDIGRFDRVMTWYGRKFDIPYIRTRALVTGVSFFLPKTKFHNDLYYIAKLRLKLSSNRLENVARVVLKRSNKTHLESKFWRGGVRGDKRSLDYILDHNRRDVIDLERVYLALRDAAPQNDTFL